MKKLLCFLLCAVMVMTTFLTVPIIAQADAKIITFDDLTEFKNNTDYLRGGAYNGAVTLSNEQDHTTGTGKSLKLEGRTSYSHRVKIKNLLTKDLVGKEITISYWAYSPVDANLLIGAYSDVNTKYAIDPYASKSFDVKANTWTLLSLTFDNNDELVSQLGIAQDSKVKEVAETFYVDDVMVSTDGSTATGTPSTPSTPSEDTKTSLTFDDLTAFSNKTDYLRGGAYNGAVTLSSEQDHTTGTGKSLKLDGRTEWFHRIKLKNLLTKDMLGKKVTISYWAYSPVDTNLLIGAYSDVNTTYATEPYASKSFDVKANTWTLLSLTFDNKDELVSQVGIGQDSKVEVVAKTIYVDDITVSAEDAKTENLITFDNLNSISEAKIEGGGGASAGNFELSNTVFNATSGEGKSLKFSGRVNSYSRVKFMSAFDGLSQEKGTKYNISMLVKVSDASRVEAGQVTIGVVTFLGTVGNGKAYYYNKNYRYTVKKGEWTKVELPYESTGEEVYGITLDQIGITSIDVPQAEYSIPELFIDDVCVRISDKAIEPQKILTDAELKALANLGIDVILNGKRISFMNDIAPMIIENKIFVPMEKVFEKLGASVMLDNDTQTVTVKRSNDVIKLTIGNKTANVNGNDVELDAPAQIVNHRILVPVGFIAASLGCDVDWDEANQRVIITDDKIVNEINVYKEDQRQEIYGFGSAANHHAYYLMKSSEEMQQRTLKALYDVNEGIGLSIVRLEINPYTPNDKSNFKPEFQYTINPEKDVWDMDADKHQIWYMQEAMKISPSLATIAVPWSPPAWMKVNKSVVGKTSEENALAEENYDYFAEYISRWVKHYNNDLGFNVKWVVTQNEPGVNTVYASCVYSAKELLEVTKRIKEKFRQEGITTMVGGPENSNQSGTASFVSAWETINPDYIKDDLDFVVTHSYGYDSNTLDATNLERFNKPLLQTEKCTSVADKREFSNETLLRYANEIADHLNHNYNSWSYWYGIRRTDNLGTQNAESLLDFSDTTKEIQYSREYYALGQFSKFMRPGYIRVASYSLNPDVTVTSAVNPETGKIVTTVINNSDSDLTTKITGFSSDSASAYRSGEGEDLAKLSDIAIANGIAEVTLKAKTVTTFVEN